VQKRQQVISMKGLGSKIVTNRNVEEDITERIKTV
jgi:hypothetical protein